ncbi:hypothetical protein EIN_084470 [Entamoeba invadens IP1]|uniref:hypothetical protein n=1 Tax=Entamoeba invadens IP1 TaxID=370355 RepID=UPI0002C3D167|nr:hypothetical protein EIN_084470 [Entamoeba invadens IP1]ELP85265.1 hypothetical protein EIN_084470 [Entamoeba invadens IP1]|eukprot:XP_004184611.1 hypothetical protein EIN_084470 [Entamoeba invadens IP1]
MKPTDLTFVNPFPSTEYSSQHDSLNTSYSLLPTEQFTYKLFPQQFDSSLSKTTEDSKVLFCNTHESQSVSQIVQTSKQSDNCVQVILQRPTISIKENPTDCLDSKFYPVCQQAVLVSLLNKKYAITLKAQKKQTTKTIPIPIVLSLSSETQTIGVFEIADQKCRQTLEEDLKSGVNRQAAIRRFDKNRRTSMLHLMADLCIEEGYFFNYKLPRPSKKTIQLERITSIFLNNTWIMDKEQIFDVGLKINMHITKRLIIDKTFVLKPKELDISLFMNN